MREYTNNEDDGSAECENPEEDGYLFAPSLALICVFGEDNVGDQEGGDFGDSHPDFTGDGHCFFDFLVGFYCLVGCHCVVVVVVVVVVLLLLLCCCCCCCCCCKRTKKFNFLSP